MNQIQRRLLSFVAISVAIVCCGHAASAAHHHHSAETKTTTKGHQSTRHHGAHSVTQFLGSKRQVVSLGRHSRHHRHERAVARQPKTRYAYSIGMFMLNPPAFEQSAFPSDISTSIKSAFYQGTADNYPPRALVKAGIAYYHPLRGGIFWRREPVRYVIVHSTETGIPLGAVRVIESWNSMGRRHPGAQYVIDRDGTIYQALDPDLASVHVNIFKTLPGINNDNSVGIEMCHSGKQEYTDVQVDSLIKLVVYLQARYHVPDENVVTHRYAQQGDHTDPVNFAWDKFIADKDRLETQGVNLKVAMLNRESSNWQIAILPPPDVMLELHQRVKLVPRAVAVPPKDITGGVTNPVRFKTETASVPIDAPRKNVAKIPLSLPLRGPIELDPAAAKILERSPEVPSVAGVPAAKPEATAATVTPTPTFSQTTTIDRAKVIEFYKAKELGKVPTYSSGGAPIPTGTP